MSSVNTEVYQVQFGGQFWQANNVSVSTEPGSTTTMTVRLITDELPPRVVEQTVDVRFQDIANQPPTLAPIRNRTLFEDRLTILPIEVSDPDHSVNLLTWSIESDQPAVISSEQGWRIVRNGDQFELELHPTPDAFGAVNLKLKVEDPEGASSEESFRLTIRPVNDIPTLNPISDVVINPGEIVTNILLTGVSDGSQWEDQTLSFSIEISDASIISEAVIDYVQGASDGLLKLTTIQGADGNAEISVTLSDGQGANHSVTESFQTTLLPQKNEPPSITWGEPLDGTTFFEGEAISLKVIASDPDGNINNVTFFANGAPINTPPSLVQEIQWTPDQLGHWELRANVEDDKKAEADTRTISIEVIARPPEFSLSIQYPEDPLVVCVGDMVEVGVELSGGPAEGTVVHFFAGDRLQGVRNASPYVFQWEVQEMGDFLLTAHAFREDGSVVISESIRAGVSDTCRQVAILISDSPVEDPEVIQELLFEMGVGSAILPLETVNVAVLSSYDMVLGFEDVELGVTSRLVDRLDLSFNELNVPIFALGHHLVSNTSALSEEEETRWRALTHLQSFEEDWLADVFELQETGFFRPILEGRFGTVEPFRLTVELDRAIADESVEVIAFSGEADAFVRYPVGTEPDFGQARKLIQNYPLLSEGDEHSFVQRKRLFQNAVCWALRCSACSNADLPVTPVAWQVEAKSGEVVRQTFQFTNNGFCELSAGRVSIEIPFGLIVEGIEMSKGLGWRRESDDGQITLNLGRMVSGSEGAIQVDLSLRGLTPGEYVVEICSESNNTDLVCTEQPFTVTGTALIPPKIFIARGDEGKLLLVIKGQEGMRYRVESSLDFDQWDFLGSAAGAETTIPLPTNQDGVPITLFYRATIAL